MLQLLFRELLLRTYMHRGREARGAGGVELVFAVPTSVVLYTELWPVGCNLVV